MTTIRTVGPHYVEMPRSWYILVEILRGYVNISREIRVSTEARQNYDHLQYSFHFHPHNGLPCCCCKQLTYLVSVHESESFKNRRQSSLAMSTRVALDVSSGKPPKKRILFFPTEPVTSNKFATLCFVFTGEVILNNAIYEDAVVMVLIITTF